MQEFIQDILSRRLFGCLRDSCEAEVVLVQRVDERVAADIRRDVLCDNCVHYKSVLVLGIMDYGSGSYIHPAAAG